MPPEASHALAIRDGLPEALRLLIDVFPREGWRADPNFGGLVQFWLDRHLSFRRLMGMMQGETRRLLDGGDPIAFGSHLSRLGSRFLQEIHGHHTIEDTHFFPLLSAQERRLASGFDLLEADHHDLDAHLGAFADRANGALRALDRPVGPRTGDLMTEGGLLLASLGTLDRFLDRHLTDEEDLVVPVILRDGEGFLA